MRILLFLVCLFNQGETISDTKNLLEVEKDLAQIFMKYYHERTKKLDALETFLNTCEQEIVGNVQQSGDEPYLGNPTNSWTLINRLVKKWPTISNFSHSKQQVNKIDKLTAKIRLLKDFNLYNYRIEKAAYTIYKVQETYELDVKAITEDFGPVHKMRAEDMYDIGYHGTLMNYRILARDWLEKALKLFIADSKYWFKLPHLYENLAWNSYQSGDIESALDYTEKHLQVEPDSLRSRNNLGHYKRKLIASVTNPNVLPNPRLHIKPWMKQHYKLCRQDYTIPAKIQKHLHCEYVTSNYQFYIKPMKMETINNEPKIVVYHDILQDYEIEHVTKLARQKIGESTNLNHVGMSTWIDHDQDDITMNVINRIGALTNLDMDYSEQLQVVNNGIEGYKPHYDFASAPQNDEIFGYYSSFGNRIASVFMFLTDVEYGGDITFLEAGKGVIASPRKGSAVFWYNLKRNGTGDIRTIHAECPVLLSDKWIANLWIHEHGQEFARPCSIVRDE